MSWHQGIIELHKQKPFLVYGKKLFYLFAQWPNGWRIKEWRDDEIDRLFSPIVAGPFAYGTDLCFWLNQHEATPVE